MIVKEERIGNQRLILGDCLQVMPLLGKVDAVVTDPPFGIKRDKGFGVGGSAGWGGFYARREGVKRYEGAWDAERPPEPFFEAALAMSERAIIWGGQFFADLLPPQGKWLWWDKCQTMPSFGDGELAWTNLSGDAPKKFVYSNNGLMAREKDRVHPTQKPVALMEWCLGFLPNAKTILDPFMGSGTTLVACQRMGRHGIGIELDPDYFAIACKRVDEAARQPDLLIPETRAAPVQEGLDL
jgi:DNA modification methylase